MSGESARVSVKASVNYVHNVQHIHVAIGSHTGSQGIGLGLDHQPILPHYTPTISAGWWVVRWVGGEYWQCWQC